jgi:hypothetical protein
LPIADCQLPIGRKLKVHRHVRSAKSAIGNQQLAIGNWQSAIGKQSTKKG